MLEGVAVIVVVEAKPPVFPGGHQREWRVKGGRSKGEGSPY